MLHRDLYGEHVFPLQCTFLLSQVGIDFDGGEFLLVEQRARQQSIGTVVPLQEGIGVIFPVYTRPVPGKRGMVREQLRHVTGLASVR